MFYTDRNPTILDSDCLCMFLRYARWRAFIPSTITTLNRLGLGEQVLSIFTSVTMKRIEDMLVYQSNPMGVELFPYVNTSVEFLLHSLRTEI